MAAPANMSGPLSCQSRRHENLIGREEDFGGQDG